MLFMSCGMGKGQRLLFLAFGPKDGREMWCTGVAEKWRIVERTRIGNFSALLYATLRRPGNGAFSCCDVQYPVLHREVQNDYRTLCEKR